MKHSEIMVVPRLVLALLALLAFQPDPASAMQDGSEAEIRAALTGWMADFNAGRQDKVCDLFAPDLRADFRGQPERDHAALCGLLQRSLRDPARSFTYGLDIKEILVFGDTAVVRLVWTLTVTPKGGGNPIVTSKEPGMDIFRRQADGSWKIVRYLAYDE